MSPLLQPKVEIMIAAAIALAPPEPRAACKAATEEEGERQSSAGVANFAPGESHIRPGGLGEKWSHHRLAEEEEERECACHPQAGLGQLRRPAIRPRIPPSGGACRAGRFPA